MVGMKDGKPRIWCIVLAAGAGRRFGGRKQLADLGGQPLLAHVLAVGRSVPSLDPLVVVLGAHAAEIREAVDFAGSVERIVLVDGGKLAELMIEY